MKCSGKCSSQKKSEKYFLREKKSCRRKYFFREKYWLGQSPELGKHFYLVYLSFKQLFRGFLGVWTCAAEAHVEQSKGHTRCDPAYRRRLQSSFPKNGVVLEAPCCFGAPQLAPVIPSPTGTQTDLAHNSTSPKSTKRVWAHAGQSPKSRVWHWGSSSMVTQSSSDAHYGVLEC